MQERYNHKKLESKWQNRWDRKRIFSFDDIRNVSNKFYNLWMFPYPSAEGLHAGHAFASTGSDVYGRFMRMNGKEVFQPIGFDSFGIHSENYAIKIGETPQEMLARTIRRYCKQLRALGHCYDWKRTVTTSDIDYYKWTQWIFVQMFKSGLAYRKKASVNWCPSCKTVLSDEQVMTPAQAGKEPKDVKGNIVEDKEGLIVCERCGTLIESKNLEQWFFRITDYADRLLENLSKIDWPEKIKIAQRNWIGKKDGITIRYPIVIGAKTKKYKYFVDCWTSRPDTNFGATFIVTSPEYARKYLFELISSEYRKPVEKYIKTSLLRSKESRIFQNRQKTGVFTGLYALNRINNYKMPIWITDFVLSDVGTGAVVGVPGHDKRDFEFAKKFNLEIKRVVVDPGGDMSKITSIQHVYEGDGLIINSGFLDGLDTKAAIEKMIGYLEKNGWGKRKTNYHLRDWLISRQRYWGAPIPMIYCSRCAAGKRGWFNNKKLKDKKSNLLHSNQSDWSYFGWWPEDNLPVNLPKIKDFRPEGKGKGPLANHPEFYQTTCPSCGSKAIRETDVMDTFVDSSWYFLRYPSVATESSKRLAFDSEITSRWLPVDLYFGGAEHAVLHLMYSRFVWMALRDMGFLGFSKKRFLKQSSAEKDWDEPFPRFFAHGLMIKDGAKMSKSRGNVVNPDEYIEKYGSDTLRLYLMFMGPMDGYPDFRDTGIEGMYSFIERVWKLFNDYGEIVIVEEDKAKKIMIKMHQTIKKVTLDIQRFHYNTAIASIMEFVNLLRETALCYKAQNLKLKKDKNNYRLSLAKKRIGCAEWQEALKVLCLLLAPFAPHMTEEVWQEYYAKDLGSRIQNSKKNIRNSLNYPGQRFNSVHFQPWPRYDPNLIKEEVIKIVIQVNGRIRSTIDVEKEDSLDRSKVLMLAEKNEKVRKWIMGKEVKKEIFVPGKLVNFVLK